MQHNDQAVDVCNWRRDEEFAQYPEGARDKTLVYCPSPAPYNFLRSGHRYLFKLSSPRYPEQFWMEVFAYLLGIKMDIPVPPAFVAYDSKKNQSGALIEWFLNSIPLLGDENYIPGGDYCQQYIPNFDRKKGKQHNFETVSQIFEDLNKKHPHFNTDWKSYWAKAFIFDALSEIRIGTKIIGELLSHLLILIPPPTKKCVFHQYLIMEQVWGMRFFLANLSISKMKDILRSMYQKAGII